VTTVTIAIGRFRYLECVIAGGVHGGAEPNRGMKATIAAATIASQTVIG